MSPRAVRLRQLLVRHICLDVTEQTRPERVAQLHDEHLTRCPGCGTWTTSSACPRCAPLMDGATL